MECFIKNLVNKHNITLYFLVLLALLVSPFFLLLVKSSTFMSEQIGHYVQETSINEYFKPIEKEAEVIMQMQLEREATTMTEMMKEMHRQALLEQVEAEKKMAMQNLEKNKQLQESAPTTSQPERWLSH